MALLVRLEDIMVRLLPALSILLFVVSVATGGPIEDMAVNSWLVSPSTDTISAHTPSPFPGTQNGASYENIVEAWGGAAYDNTRGRYILALNGGHNDYDGNEIYAQDIRGTGTWSRIWGPSPNGSGGIPTSYPRGGGSETYGDGNPASRHVYQAEVYHPGVDAIIVFGGILRSAGGSGSKATWLFFFSGANAGTWKQGPGFPVSGTYDGSGIAAYDPSKGKIHVAVGTLNGFSTFTPSQTSPYGSWSNTTSASAAGEGAAGALDYHHRKWVTQGVNGWRVINVDTGASSALSTTGTGPSAAYYRDMAYDPVLQKIIVHSSSGSRNFYTLDVSGSTGVWASVTGTGVTPGSTTTGHESRLTYMPDKQAFALVNGISQRTYFLRTSPYQGQTPVPPKVLSVPSVINVN